MMFYGGGGVSAVGNPENVAKDPKTLTSVNELRNLIFCDYGEFKKDLQQMQLHEGWGDFKSITYKDCIIPIEQEEKLRKIDIQSPGQISIQSEDITDFQPVPISNQPKAEETHTQSELNQNVDSALALDDGLEFTDAFAKDRNMDGEDAKMEEEEIFSHDALQFELLSTQLSEPSSTQIVGNDYPLSPLFGSSFHPDEGFVDSLDGAAVSIEDFSQSLKTQDPTIEIEQIDEISSFVAVSQEKKNENPVSDSIFQEFQTQELGNSQENEASDDGLFVDYMGIEDDFATQAAPTQDQDPNEIEEINTALLKEAQKLINQSYAATQTQNLNDNLVTQATNPQEISEVKPEPMDTPTQIVTNTFMTKNPPSDVGQSHENPASQKVIDPSESIRSESSSSVPADSLGNELHTQPVEVVDNPDKDSISDSLSFTSETSCSYIFKGINVTPRGFEQDVVSDELEDLPIFSLDGEGASCLADTLIIDSNVEKLIGANSDESRILDSVEIMKAQDTTTAIRDRESNSRQASKPLSPQNNEGVELNRWAEKINLDDENLRLNNQEPPTTTKDGNGGALIQKGPGDKYSLGAQIEVPQTDLDTVNPIPFLGATIGAVPGQITGEKETQEAIKPSPPRTHVSIVSSGFSGVQTPKNRFRGVMSADSPLWTQLDHSQPSNPATPTIGSLKISPNPQTPVISQMLIASSQPTAKYLSDKPEHVQIERIPSSDNSKSNRLEQDKIQILESEYESHTADSQLSFMPVGISPIKNRAIVSDRVLQQLDKKMKPTDSSRHESSPVLLRNTVKRHIISANLLKALNESIPSSPVVKDLDTNESAIYISDAKLDIGMQENGNMC